MHCDCHSLFIDVRTLEYNCVFLSTCFSFQSPLLFSAELTIKKVLFAFRFSVSQCIVGGGGGGYISKHNRKVPNHM